MEEKAYFVSLRIVQELSSILERHVSRAVPFLAFKLLRLATHISDCIHYSTFNAILYIDYFIRSSSVFVPEYLYFEIYITFLMFLFIFPYINYIQNTV